MNQGIVNEVMDIIANGYGSMPTGIDRAVALNVVNYFYRKGWRGPEDIAELIKNAKVNPDAEVRVVNSGPIDMKYVRGAEERINANPGPHS
jgi:hypothetical protein